MLSSVCLCVCHESVLWPNGNRLTHSCYGGQLGNHMLEIERDLDLWPWMTLKEDSEGQTIRVIVSSEVKRYRLENWWWVAKWDIKRNGRQKCGILGNQDGGRGIIWKSRKRLKLGQMKSYRLEIWWEVGKWASKRIRRQKCGILGNQGTRLLFALVNKFAGMRSPS